MADVKESRGFSLTEILVSLLVVCITAVNIVGLQQRVGQQGRDNFVHGAVLKMVMAKMDEVLQFKSLADLEGLTGMTETVVEKHTATALNLAWRVTVPDKVYKAGSNVRNVELQVGWNDSRGELQTYRYREQVNLIQLMEVDADLIGQDAAIIESFLGTNEIIYFDSKRDYKKGAFVIYNSELFKATKDHARGKHAPFADDLRTVAKGWKSYGLINNPELAKNPDLVTLF